MEQALERVKKVVSEYDPVKEGGRLKTIRALLSSMVALRKFISENSQEDRGCAQRIARELDDTLAALPDFATFADKQAQAARHTKRLAEEHIDDIENYLKRIVAEDDANKKKLIHDWVKAHSVLGELKRVVTSKSLPKKAYVLIFKADGDDDSFELLTRKNPDNAIISRLRPHEFFDDFRVHKAYQRMNIAGAAVICEQELISVIGRVPQPKGNQTQLQALLAVSKEAVGRPAQEFIQENRVLKQLYDLARRRKVPKDAYILLFQQTDEEGDGVYPADVFVPAAPASSAARLATVSNGDKSSANAVATPEFAQGRADIGETRGDISEDGACSSRQHSDGNAPAESDQKALVAEHPERDVNLSSLSGESDASIAPADFAHGFSAEEQKEDEQETVESLAAANSADYMESSDEDRSDVDSADAECCDVDVANTNGSDDEDSNHEGSDSGDVADGESGAGPVSVKIVVRKTSDGKVITRFWPADFAVKHKLFDEFKEKSTVVGAAIIKRNEMVRVLGRVPIATGAQSRLDAVMRASRLAVEKPAIEFVNEHEVLRGLHALANQDAHRDGCVIMFVLGESGRVEVASGDPVGAKLLLSDFRFAKLLHDRFFAKTNIVGASVVAAASPPARPASDRDRDNKRDDRSRNRNEGPRRDAAGPKPSVVAAFGRTPLKINLLATPENFARLGINLDATRLFELERPARPGSRPFHGGKPVRKGPHDNLEKRDSRKPHKSRSAGE